MTPQEKAEGLVDKYYLTLKESKGYYDLPNAKQCALISVDEILNINSVDKDLYLSEYWEQVKTEIEKL